MGFSKNLREELKPYNIKVTAVYPGAVYTSSWADSGVEPARIMEVNDISEMVFAASILSPQALCGRYHHQAVTGRSSRDAI